MILVYIFLTAVTVLLVVTRLAAKRDALKKAELARRAQAAESEGPDAR